MFFGGGITGRETKASDTGARTVVGRLRETASSAAIDRSTSGVRLLTPGFNRPRRRRYEADQVSGPKEREGRWRNGRLNQRRLTQTPYNWRRSLRDGGLRWKTGPGL